MCDFSRLPSVPIGLVLGSDPLPPPRGPMRLDLANVCATEAPEVLQRCFSRMGFQYELIRLPDVPFIASLALNVLPGVLVAGGHLHGTRTCRRSVHVQDDTDILMLINRQGSFLIEQFGRQQVLGEGEAILVSGADPSVFDHRPPGEMLALRISRDVLLPLLRGGAAALMRPIPAGTPALQLLTRYLSLTWDTGDRAPLDLMAAHICDLAASAAGATGDATETGRNGGLRAARLHAVKQDIAARIAEPELTLATVAARHRLTPRSLQRLFESEGTTFSHHVLATRLAAAHRLLRGPRAHADKISAIAFDCGFGDLSYFNRAFRRRFGKAPSDVRAAEPRGD